MTMQERNEHESGFTLIELLVVIAVVGIVGAIAIPSLLRAKITANESAIIGSIRAVNSAQAAYTSAAAPGGCGTIEVPATRRPRSPAAPSRG
jgi:prepilin-type N-terminal cleavage/methylation domain-containing protein